MWIVEFLFLAGVRLLASQMLPISDCDETYNYWEPAHQLVFGTGKQTWEYDPQFALRSWLFVWLYAWPSYLVVKIFGSAIAKPLLFYGTKALIALCCAACETYLVRGAARCFAPRVSKMLFLLLLASPGIAQASAAFLPSSFAMMGFCLCAGAWLRLYDITVRYQFVISKIDDAAKKTQAKMQGLREASSHLGIGVWSVATLTIVGWPFACLVGGPFALHAIYMAGFGPTLKASVVAGAILCILVSVVDSFYYCSTKGVFSTYNLVMYNVFGGKDRGSHLYGLEPWHFFFKNLTLNWNVAFWVALAGYGVSFLRLLLGLVRRHDAALVVSPSSRSRHPSALHTIIFGAPFALWFVFWLRIPHKEERFMVPAYPFLALLAALSLTQLMGTTTSLAPCKKEDHSDCCGSAGGKGHSHGPAQNKARLRPRQLVVSLLLAAYMFLGMGRGFALSYFYSGPERVSNQLYYFLQPNSAGNSNNNKEPKTLCIGKEWFRHPSSYFVPTTEEGLRFLKTESFSGALPRPFRSNATTEDGTLQIPATCRADPMNDLNKEEKGQYLAQDQVEATCDFILDTAPRDEEVNDETERKAEDPYRKELRDTKTWRPLVAGQMLDVAKTPQYCRLIYFPWLTDRCLRFVDVVVLERRRRQ